MTRAPTSAPDAEPQADSLSDEAARNTLALNPLIGLRGEDLMDSAAILLRALVNEPAVAGGQWLSFLGELGTIGAGQSDRVQQAGDKRFADATWKNSAAHRRLLQAYLAWGDALNGFIDKTSLNDIDKSRARLVAGIFIDAASPTNNPMSNPAAVRQFLDTGGESLWRGFKNYLADLVENGGLPAQVDKSPFKLGVNLATTPGAVVFRNEVLEVIQYKTTATDVRKRPLVITPPQINKFYSLDLSPEKSLVQYLLKSGIQVFCVSWRNPTAKERDWGFDTYVAALDEGTDAVREITQLRRRHDDGRLLWRNNLRGLCRMARAQGRGEDQEYRRPGLRARYDHCGRKRDWSRRDARNVGRRQACVAAARRARRSRPGARVRVDAAQRFDLELLGEQLLAGQPASGFRYPLLERRHDLSRRGSTGWATRERSRRSARCWGETSPTRCSARSSPRCRRPCA